MPRGEEYSALKETEMAAILLTHCTFFFKKATTPGGGGVGIYLFKHLAAKRTMSRCGRCMVRTERMPRPFYAAPVVQNSH